MFASLTLFPAIFLSCIIAPIAGKIYDKFGAKWLLIIGFLLMAVFAVMLAFFITSPSLILIGAMYVPVIIGSALVIGPVQSYGLSSLKPQDNPHGVTIFSTGFQIAGCIGASLFSSIYTAIIATNKDIISGANTSFMIVGLIIAGVACLGILLSIILNRLKAKENKVKHIEGKVETSEKGIRGLMKTDVYTILNNATMLDVMKFFVEKQISGCPIVDENNNFVGFISDGDIVRYLSKNHSTIKSAYIYQAVEGQQNEFESKLKEVVNLKITDLCSKDIFFVDVNEDLGEVCRVLAETHKKKVPVMENGKMIGIITRSDITKYAIKCSINLLSKN